MCGACIKQTATPAGIRLKYNKKGTKLHQCFLTKADAVFLKMKQA